MRSRAGLEAEWVGNTPRVMGPGAVRCALAYEELKGEGIVEEARRGERGASAASSVEHSCKVTSTLANLQGDRRSPGESPRHSAPAWSCL